MITILNPNKSVNPYDVTTHILPYLTTEVTIQEFNHTPPKAIKNAFQALPEGLYLTFDSKVFKVLAKVTKATPHIGYVLPVTDNKFIAYSPNPSTLFSNPEAVKRNIVLTLTALEEFSKGNYRPLGKGIIHSCSYPQSNQEIATALQQLLAMDLPLTIDIETYSLSHVNSGIASIAFAWDNHNGIAFQVGFNFEVRRLLKEFFIAFKQPAIYHNASFDVTILTYQLFMESLVDTSGLLEGLAVLTRNFEDTKLIAYLTTNSCQGNNLSLKVLAQEFAGNYAVDVSKAISKIPLAQLLEYNLVDCLSTWWVYNKHYPILITDQQEDIYTNIFKPAVVDVIQMQLTGIPINLQRVAEVKAELLTIQAQVLEAITTHHATLETTTLIQEEWVIERNKALKTKRVSLSDCKLVFNINSNAHLQKLLYEVLELPILSYTDSKQPATDKASLQKLAELTKEKSLLEAIINYKNVNKILSVFIPTFEGAICAEDSHSYLFGSFNLGGTVSGRLSSSNPNLQNLPSNSTYGKLIKSCIQSNNDWLFVGIDFSSLEDRISALTTKDPNKLKCYTDGYDGHCLRAFAYYPEQMPDIVDTVESINSIATKYKSLRQASKTITFALTYGGTYHTLMSNCGLDEASARRIEANYHRLYAVSDAWVNDRLKTACSDGYVTAAFGLRVRTPLLKQSILGNSKTLARASAEGRTAGNALGQSWGLLNSRACSDFMQQVRQSQYRLSIRPVAQIHDAIYFMVRDDVDLLVWLNNQLVTATEWNNHPDIYHPDVGLGGELSLFYPSWKDEIVIPNRITRQNLINLINKETHT